MKQLIIMQSDEGKRLDHFLVEQLNLNRSQVSNHIKTGHVLVNDKVTKAGYKLNINDHIMIQWMDKDVVNPLEPKAIDLNIVYEDDDIIVINKPKGLVVHPSETYADTTLVSGLLHYSKNLSNVNDDPYRPGIVHRIDKDTSGLLLVAKTNEAHKILASNLKKHEIKREYLALVHGELAHQKGLIEAPIGRHPKVRTKMAAIPNGKLALTHFEVFKSYPKYTLLHCKLETGRTHQIRVHLAYIHHPVVGDPLYGIKDDVKTGQLLHAFKLEFVHPITKKIMVLEAPLPSEFENYLKQLS